VQDTVGLGALVGSGWKIVLLVLPFLVVGVALNVLFPSAFSVGGPPAALAVLSIIVLDCGTAVWAWSVVLIRTKVPKGELITSGPYSVVKHPLYTAVALLIWPWVGFLFDTWLGLALGIVMYVGRRMFAPEEERALSEKFGAAWDDYSKNVKMPWL
jgi:protein-S-isoprenylcysteine O-methyltransferase Ste14